MRYKIAPEIISEIEAFLKQISVAHNLDNEIREELRSHIEDKLCGYMRGEIKITEEEAWLLVREHFGDPAVLKSMYHETEAKEMYKSFFRRIGAAFVAGIWILTITRMVIHGILTQALKGVAGRTVDAGIIFAYGFLWMIPDLFVILLFFFFVMRWRKIIENSGTAWFMTIKSVNFVLLILMSTILSTVTILLLFNSQPHFFFHSLIPLDNTTTELLSFFPGFAGFNYIMLQFFYCFGWLLLCDIPPRRFQLIIAGFISWMFSIVIFNQFVGIISVFRHPSMIDMHTLLMVLTPHFYLMHENLYYGGPAFIAYCLMALIYYFRQKKSILTT